MWNGVVVDKNGGFDTQLSNGAIVQVVKLFPLT